MRFRDLPGWLKMQGLYFLSNFEKAAHLYGLKQVEAEQLPNFLCIGAQKAGTTWLYENLRCHPEIFIPEERALHYFDYQFYRPLSFYQSHFKNQEEKCKGEVMPGYGLLTPKRIRFIHHLLPHLKIIYLLRNPIDRAWSHAKMHFTKFQQRPLASVSNIELIEHFRSTLSLEKGNYLHILAKWEKVFPQEAFLYLYFENLVEQPEHLLNQVFKHLGVSEITDFSPFKAMKKINAGATNEIPEECLDCLKEMYAPALQQMQSKFGAPIDCWIKKYYG